MRVEKEITTKKEKPISLKNWLLLNLETTLRVHDCTMLEMSSVQAVKTDCHFAIIHKVHPNHALIIYLDSNKEKVGFDLFDARQPFYNETLLVNDCPIEMEVVYTILS